MAVFDNFDVTKIDPNLMNFFKSAEFAELIHQASDLGVGDLGQHHNLGLTGVDAAPGNVVAVIKKDLTTVISDLDDLEDVVDGIETDITDIEAEIAGLSGPEWHDTNANRIRNPSFTVWDGSTSDLTHYPDGGCTNWDFFWILGTRGVIAKENDSVAHDGHCLSWTPADAAGSIQRIATNVIHLTDSDTFSPVEVSIWAKSLDASKPMKLTIDVYSANHDHPAPFDGSTTVTTVMATVTLNHTEWRKYTAIMHPIGLAYHAMYFSFTSDAPGDQVGYLDRAEFNNSLVSMRALAEGVGTGLVPFGYNNTGSGGSRGYDVTATGDALGATTGVHYLTQPLGNNPVWKELKAVDVSYPSVGSTVDAQLTAILATLFADTGWITSTTGFSIASNWTLTSVRYRVLFGLIVQLNFRVARTTSAITVAAGSGNITDVSVVTVPAAIRPAGNVPGWVGTAGRLVGYTMGSSGLVELSAAAGDGTNIPSGETIEGGFVYFLG